jgi:uncharacterized membrane protein YfcA
MTLATLAAFLALAAVAAYVQTLTGFAFGLIMMGAVAMMNLLPLPDAAAVVGALTLVNAAQMVAKGWRHVAWREWRIVVLCSLPTVIVGFTLLQWLAAERLDALRLVLAAVIIVASLQILKTPKPGRAAPSDASFAAAGVVSGLMGGLFSTGGPPVIYRFYTSHLPLATIRETLVAIFALNAVMRLTLVFGTGARPPASTWMGLLAVPLVIGATAAARRWPPPISPQRLRVVVAGLLAASGLALGAPALIRMLGG